MNYSFVVFGYDINEREHKYALQLRMDQSRITISFTDTVKPYNMLSHLENNSNVTKQTAVAIAG